jgi:hypothetical protein
MRYAARSSIVPSGFVANALTFRNCVGVSPSATVIAGLPQPRSNRMRAASRRSVVFASGRRPRHLVRPTAGVPGLAANEAFARDAAYVRLPCFVLALNEPG